MYVRVIDYFVIQKFKSLIYKETLQLTAAAMFRISRE